MSEAATKNERYISQPIRLLVLLGYCVSLLIVCKLVTGVWFPVTEGRRLWILSGIAYLFFGLISAPFFRPPRDAIANSVSVCLLLATLDLSAIQTLRAELDIFRWIGVCLTLIVIAFAVIAIITSTIDPVSHPKTGSVSKVAQILGDNLGRGELVFTIPAFIGILGYYQSNHDQQLWLMFVWLVIVVIKPLELAFKIISSILSLFHSKASLKQIGEVKRVDNPNIVRVSLNSEELWSNSRLAIVCLPNGEQRYVLPLFKHIQDNEFVGTGLMNSEAEDKVIDAVSGHVYSLPKNTENEQLRVSLWQKLSCEPGQGEMAGFVVEGASISTIKFEVAPNVSLQEGNLVFCKQGESIVYYQIIGAETSEESFSSNPQGKQIAYAAQIGALNDDNKFLKHPWLPEMNTPIFLFSESYRFPEIDLPEGQICIGKIPSSDIAVRADLSQLIDYHTAVLGVTGTGKTELVFDLINSAIDQGVKVFCVDFTGEYQARLTARGPVSIGLDKAKAEELDNRLFDVETGKFGAGDEKAALRQFVEEIIPVVGNGVDDFLRPEGGAVGIFSLPEITNTKATLRATELYLSSIMRWAKDNRKARRVMVVLEEAHTIIPETGGAGFDFETQWVVGRISQIALQGRKYGVGLLVVSQRTALVSKSILSQCNTYFTHSLIDRTSLEYLTNVYSAEHVKVIPNLRFLECLAYGKAILSERPVIVKREFDESKKEASDSLDVKITSGDVVQPTASMVMPAPESE